MSTNYIPLTYSDVSSVSAPSSSSGELPYYSLPTPITMVCKPGMLYKHQKEGYVKVLNQIPVGKHGCRRYNLNVYTTDKRKPPFTSLMKIECKPLFFVVNKIMRDRECGAMINTVKLLATNFLQYEIDRVIIEEYPTQDTENGDITLFYPSIQGDYVYVTNKERVMIPFDVNDYVGKEIITTSPLFNIDEDDVEFPNAYLYNGNLVYNIQDMEKYDNSDITEFVNEVNDVVVNKGQNGDIFIPVDDSSASLVEEICEIWGIFTTRDNRGNLIVHNTKYTNLDVKDAARQIFLNHPPMVRIVNNTNNERNERKERKGGNESITNERNERNERWTLKKFVGDTRQLPGILSVPAWTPDDLDVNNDGVSVNVSGDMPLPQSITLPPYNELVVDSSEVYLFFDDFTFDLVYIRSWDSTQAELNELGRLVLRAWETGRFTSRWGAILWNLYGKLSCFYTKSVFSFDTAKEAIQTFNIK